MSSNRIATINRKTKETSVALKLNLDGEGKAELNSGVGFFDHMLEQVVRYAKIDLTLDCKGDTHIDDHHSVEDIGICFGLALQEAIGNKQGIYRFGHAYVPLDEAISRAVVDLAGRSHLTFNCKFPTEQIKDFDLQLVQEFFTALVNNAKMTLHLDSLRGINSHHISETIFKAFGKALRIAIAIDNENINQIPSTKGVL